MGSVKSKPATPAKFVGLEVRQNQLTQQVKVNRFAMETTTTTCCVCGEKTNPGELYLCPQCTADSRRRAEAIEEIATNERAQRIERHRQWIDDPENIALHGAPNAKGKY